MQKFQLHIITHKHNFVFYNFKTDGFSWYSPAQKNKMGNISVPMIAFIIYKFIQAMVNMWYCLFVRDQCNTVIESSIYVARMCDVIW